MACSDSDNKSKNNIEISTATKSIEDDIVIDDVLIYSVKKIKPIFRIDTSAILSNSNLTSILSKIESDSIEEKTSKKFMPKFIANALNSVSITDTFDIADFNQPFQSTDVVDDNPYMPNRQITYLGIGKHTVIIAFYTGGVGMCERVLLFGINNDKIRDFWTGTINIENKNKKEIIKYLKTNSKLSPWLLNSNRIYL
ncbi:hypothetical protein [Hymenobacter tenuis]